MSGPGREKTVRLKSPSGRAEGRSEGGVGERGVEGVRDGERARDWEEGIPYNSFLVPFFLFFFFPSQNAGAGGIGFCNSGLFLNG